MKVSQYQFRLKYHTDSKSTVKARRLDYVREYGYNGEDVSPEDMAALEYLDSIECHLRELASRIDSGWNTAPVKEAKLEAILEKANTSFVCEWAEALLGMVYRHKGRYERLRKRLAKSIQEKLRVE